MVKKVTSQLTRSMNHSTTVLRDGLERGRGASLNTLGELLELLPTNHRAQAFQQVTDLASDALNLLNARHHRDATLAQYHRDMHLSDNEVRKAQLHLEEALAERDMRRMELDHQHQYTMQAQAHAAQQFDQKMAEVTKLLEDYRRTRDPNTLTMVTRLLA